MSRWVMIGAFFLSAFFVVSIGLAQISLDPREQVNPNLRGNEHLRSIGRLVDRKLKKSATAVLISACHILTNRHASGGIVQTAPGEEIEEDLSLDVIGNVLEFEIGFDVLQTSKLRSVTQATVVASGQGGDLDDWAVLRLKNSLGKRYGESRPQVVELSPGDILVTAGYPVDKYINVDSNNRGTANVWLWKEEGIFQESRLYWIANFHVMSGQSGSPVFAKRGDEYAMVGLIRGEFPSSMAGAHRRTEVMPLGPAIDRINALLVRDPCD